MNQVRLRVFLILWGAWRRRYLIVMPILLLPLAGLVVGHLSPKKYTAHTSMLIQETAKMNPFLEDLAVSAMIKERMDALQTLLHSRHILGLVAEEQGLTNESTPRGERDRVITRLSSALKVTMAGKDLIRIDFTAPTPKGIQKTLELVSAHFVDQVLAPERSSMTDSAQFLSDHLTQSRGELEAAEEALADYKTRHGPELPQLHNSNMTRLAELQQLQSEKEAELAGAEQGLKGIDQQLSRINPVLGSLEEKIVRIRSDLALLRSRYTDQHSEVQATLRTLRRLEEERLQVLSEDSKVIDTNQLWDMASQNSSSNAQGIQSLLVSQLEMLQAQKTRYTGLKEEVSRLKEMVGELQGKTAEFGRHERSLIKLERDLEVKRKLYQDLLHRYEMARVPSEQAKRVKIIDQPFTPTAPSNLPLILFVIGGLFGGIFLGAGMATFAELLDNSIRRRDQLERLSGAPVLSRIPPLGAPA